ncbi:MAG: hypothetical protein JWM16_1411 [Verrucomicrobiales bacterium]|nr:hypothetical protein [Verrucomicrobiales bacterium]
MNRSSKSQSLDIKALQDDFLEFPLEPTFISRHVTVSIDMVVRACEEDLIRVNQDARFRAERIEHRVDVPFEL